MLELTGLILEMKDTDGNIWNTVFWQEEETAFISELAFKEAVACKKRGWKLYHVTPYWKEAE